MKKKKKKKKKMNKRRETAIEIQPYNKNTSFPSPSVVLPNLPKQRSVKRTALLYCTVKSVLI